MVSKAETSTWLVVISRTQFLTQVLKMDKAEVNISLCLVLFDVTPFTTRVNQG